MPAPSKNRAYARANDLKRYMGAPCRHGHEGERYTISAKCCECKRLEFTAWTKTNRESYNAYARNYYHSLPPEKLAKSRARFAAKRDAWEAANRETALANRKKYWQNNREKWRVYVRNRRARLAGVPGTHTVEDIAALRAKQNDSCKYCHIDLQGKGEVDHITPLSRGGPNWPHNLQLLCSRCNQCKHAKDPVVHARAIGLLPPI